MPFGSGHSVESQITGKDAAGGIQFEVAPYEPLKDRKKRLFVKVTTGRTHYLNVRDETMIDSVKIMLYAQLGVPEQQQRLIFAGKQLEGIIRP